MSTKASKLEEQIALMRTALSTEKSKNRRLTQKNKSLEEKLMRNKQKTGRLKTRLSSELKKNESSE